MRHYYTPSRFSVMSSMMAVNPNRLRILNIFSHPFLITPPLPLNSRFLSHCAHHSSDLVAVCCTVSNCSCQRRNGQLNSCAWCVNISVMHARTHTHTHKDKHTLTQSLFSTAASTLTLFLFFLVSRAHTIKTRKHRCVCAGGGGRVGLGGLMLSWVGVTCWQSVPGSES